MKYDARSAADEQLFTEQRFNTQVCMIDAVKIPLSQGIRDQDQITAFAARVCGPVFRDHLVKRWTLTPEAADGFLKLMAENALKRTPGVQPPK